MRFSRMLLSLSVTSLDYCMPPICTQDFLPEFRVTYWIPNCKLQFFIFMLPVTDEW
jgi:hypothetical protein